MSDGEAQGICNNDADSAVASLAAQGGDWKGGPQKTASQKGGGQYSRCTIEITDADYRSIFLPCEALEEKVVQSGRAPDRRRTKRG